MIFLDFCLAIYSHNFSFLGALFGIQRWTAILANWEATFCAALKAAGRENYYTIDYYGEEECSTMVDGVEVGQPGLFQLDKAVGDGEMAAELLARQVDNVRNIANNRATTAAYKGQDCEAINRNADIMAQVNYEKCVRKRALADEDAADSSTTPMSDFESGISEASQHLAASSLLCVWRRSHACSPTI